MNCESFRPRKMAMLLNLLVNAVIKFARQDENVNGAGRGVIQMAIRGDYM